MWAPPPPILAQHTRSVKNPIMLFAGTMQVPDSHCTVGKSTVQPTRLARRWLGRREGSSCEAAPDDWTRGVLALGECGGHVWAPADEQSAGCRRRASRQACNEADGPLSTAQPGEVEETPEYPLRKKDDEDDEEGAVHEVVPADGARAERHAQDLGEQNRD